ncbi:MAG: hypothetical protein KC466_08790 [Myxococcales bacterium]|nr:hypothetical protein [Myxococcales bacterium]
MEFAQEIWDPPALDEAAPDVLGRRLRVVAMVLMLAYLSIVLGAVAGLDPVPLSVLSITYLLMRASRPSFWEVRYLVPIRAIAESDRRS